MGELLLCHEPIAALPYYVEGAGINIYSMEELSYYILNNTYLLDRSFPREELCSWIEQQMGLYKLAERLRRILDKGSSLSDFVLTILQETAYCTTKEMQDIAAVLRQMEEKSEFECDKIRADRLMEKERYTRAIYEYRKLLEGEDAGAASALLVGNIWHNLGTAYARLFLFEEAARCYERAYEYNQNQESLREALMCFRCMHDEENFDQLAEKYLVQDLEKQEIINELSLASHTEQMERFQEKLEGLASMNGQENRSGRKQIISGIIFAWKEDYREKCKI